MKIATREESDTQTGDRRVSLLLTRGNFHARSRISFTQLSVFQAHEEAWLFPSPPSAQAFSTSLRHIPY